jgi:large subunit ribosomal protein L24e
MHYFDINFSLLKPLISTSNLYFYPYSRTEICAFSGSKIYPGHGIIFVRGDSKSFRLLNGKCTAHFKAKKNPRKFNWTVFYRRLHKKGTTEEVAKRRARKAVKVQRAIVGATWEEIVAKRSEPEAVKKAARTAAAEESKQKKKEMEAAKRAEKIKNAGSARAQPKMKATHNVKSSRVQATSR